MAGPLQRGRGGGTAGRINIGRNDADPHLGEQRGRREPNPRGRAGDQRHPVTKAVVDRCGLRGGGESRPHGGQAIGSDMPAGLGAAGAAAGAGACITGSSIGDSAIKPRAP